MSAFTYYMQLLYSFDSSTIFRHSANSLPLGKYIGLNGYLIFSREKLKENKIAFLSIVMTSSLCNQFHLWIPCDLLQLSGKHYISMYCAILIIPNCMLATLVTLMCANPMVIVISMKFWRKYSFKNLKCWSLWINY